MLPPMVMISGLALSAPPAWLFHDPIVRILPKPFLMAAYGEPDRIANTADRSDCAGTEAGRGLSAYASADISRIAGHKSGEIATILGYRGRDEIIHRDDLVVTERR